MEIVDHIIYARWIIANGAKCTVLQGHAVAIQDGIIKAILPIDEINKTYSSSNVSELSDHVLIPGLINSHTHIAMNYFRGLADDLPLMDWLNNHVWPAEKQWVSHEFVQDASMFAMAEMIRCGTTCFNDMYFYPEATAQAADITGMRAHLGMTVIEFPTNWAKTTDEYFQKGMDFFDQYRYHPRITPTLAPHAPYTVSDSSFERIQTIADEYDLKINLHLHETQGEVDRSIEECGMRPIERLHKIGIITKRLIAIHMTAIDEIDFEIINNMQPSIVHCPESNMKLASGSCPTEKFLANNINLALGTDSAASNNDLDMLSEIRTAALLAKHNTGNPEALSAAQTLAMATLNGAKALGIADRTGSLEIGKAADITAISLADTLETLPIYHPLSQVVYASCREQVTDVWVNGKQLLKNRELTTIDIKEIKNKVRASQEKISG